MPCNFFITRFFMRHTDDVRTDCFGPMDCHKWPIPLYNSEVNNITYSKSQYNSQYNCSVLGIALTLA